MKKIIIPAIITVLFLFGIVSCKNKIELDLDGSAPIENIDKAGSTTAMIFIPNYQEMSKIARVISPQSAKVRLSYKNNRKWIIADTLDIDISELEKVEGMLESLPGGLWKGTFKNIPSDFYETGSLKVEFLDSKNDVISSGVNKDDTIVYPDKPSSASFYALPVALSSTGSLKKGEMLFWGFKVKMNDLYVLKVISDETYPDIVLFNSDGTFNKYIPIDSPEKATITLDKVSRNSTYYVGVYAATGAVKSYSLEVECAEKCSDFFIDFDSDELNDMDVVLDGVEITSAKKLGVVLEGVSGNFAQFPGWDTKELKVNNIDLEKDSEFSFKYHPEVCPEATISFSVFVDDEVFWCDENPASRNNTCVMESMIIPAGKHSIKFQYVNKSNVYSPGLLNSIFLDDIVLSKNITTYSTISEDFEIKSINENYKWTGGAKLTSADALDASEYEFDGMTGKFVRFSTNPFVTTKMKLKNIVLEEDSSLSFKYYPSVCSMATITFSVLVDDKVVWCDEYPAYNNYNLVLASVNIPAGNHTIEFVAANDSGWHNDGTYNSIFLDDIYLVPDVIAGVKVTPRAKQETYIGCKDYQKIIAKAYAVRADGSVKKDAVVTLSSDCGTIDENGVFTPTKVGTTKIVATCGEFTGESGEITVYDTDYMQKPYTYNGKTYNGIDVSTASVPIAPHSDDYSTIEITYPQYSTFEADGFFTLEGSVTNPSTYNYVCVSVKKDDLEDGYTYYILRDDFKRRIWLRFGEGDYTIVVWNLSSIALSAGLGAEGDYYGCESSTVAQEFHVKNTRSEYFGDSPDGRWLYPSDVVQADDLLVTNTANEILYDLPENATDSQKIKVIHDFIVGSNYYDEESLIDGYRKKQDAVSVLLNGTCVCEGYANSVAAFVRYAGIPVKVIKGMGFNGVSAEFHAWNNIYMNDKWSFLDATWDDPLPDSGIYYTYFLLDDLGGIDGDHYEYFDDISRSVVATPRIPEWRGTPGGWY